MSQSLARFVHGAFPPPSYLTLPSAGMDISTSGIKMVTLAEHTHGLEVAVFDEYKLELGAVVDGEIVDHAAVVAGISALAKKHRIRFANIALPEAKSYLFEGEVAGRTLPEWRVAIEAHIDEYVPLPPAEVVFDVDQAGPLGEKTRVVGVGFARRLLDSALAAFDSAGVEVRAVEGETFALARALFARGDTETVLVIDIGKTTTKLVIIAACLSRFATTLDIGGHALTLAVQKHFGVTEEEAKRVKAEQGLAAGKGNEEYLASMLSTVSAIREEIGRRLDYWQTHAAATGHEPVTRIILVGGNATVRGLPEYFESALKIPVALGDVFTNLASRDEWVPPIEYMESLAYGTAIGLALRDHTP